MLDWVPSAPYTAEQLLEVSDGVVVSCFCAAETEDTDKEVFLAAFMFNVTYK